MCEAVEQNGGHFGIAEDLWPFAETEVGDDAHTGGLCCTIRLMAQAPLSPDGLIPRLL